jgi:light-regulated signal transduction histidine kinase (bacteriophytochrome)
MQKAALRMLNYIRDLLEYSKVTQQQNNYQRVSFEKSRKWRIEVSGNGIGIKEKYFDRIFKPFERLHGQSEFEETGIGLAIGTME